MNAVMARAKFRSNRLGMGGGERIAAASSPARAASTASGEKGNTAVADSPLLPANEWPDHGLGVGGLRTVTVLPGGKGTIVSRRRPGSLVRTGTFKRDGGASVSWDEVILAMEGPEARARRRIAEPAGKLPVFERVEDERFMSYRFDKTANTLTSSRMRN